MLDAFRIRSFRYQWPSDMLASWAFEMESLILGWFIMVSTGSVLLLTAFGSLQFLGTLAAPMFGVVGDRLGGRTVLCAIRAACTLLAGVLAALALTGLLTPAWVLVVAALSGIVRPNDQAMRNSIIGETIPPEYLMGALGLSRASADSARVAGALVGAGLSAALGVGRAYVAVTLFYGVSLLLTFGIARTRPAPDPSAVRRITVARPSGFRELADGLRHVRTTPTLLAAMWLAFLINLTAYPVTSGLLPYVAREIYGVDATGLGWLVASFALGALVGSMGMVATGGPARPERSMLVYAAAWYALLLAFACVRSMPFGVLLLLLAGIVQSVAMVSMAGALLAAAAERFRSRVMGVRMLAVYGLPLGLVGAGALIPRIGFPPTIALLCALGLVFTLVIGLRWRGTIWRDAASLAPRSAGPRLPRVSDRPELSGD
jgi:hypothetical protein